MKKFITMLLTAVMAVSTLGLFTGCKGGDDGANEVTFPKVESATFTQFDELEVKSDFKIGLICLHGETSTYDKNFIDAFKAACSTLGLSDSQMVIVTDIPEGAECKTKALELADAGCKAIFANSFGHDPYMKQAAAERPTVQFFHATGVSAHVAPVLPNYHNAFASIYEGRYLAGVAAGLKIKEMAENNKLVAKNFDENNNVKIGYVGAFTYAEVVSGLTSFYLGVKSQYSNVVMDVQFTGSWYDEAGEREAANTLIDRGVALLSQHADSWGAPNACENAGIPNVSYNGSTIKNCPDTFIVSSKIDWTYYFKWIIASVGTDANVPAIPTDFAGGLGESCMVAMSNLNGDVMAQGTLDVLKNVRTQLMNGSLKVFDCSKFTVKGANLTEYLADLDGDYTGDTNVIKTENGVTYFAESDPAFRSAPYFDIQIDGIDFLNTKY